jgi:prevent-host-death family protein
MLETQVARGWRAALGFGTVGLGRAHPLTVTTYIKAIVPRTGAIDWSREGAGAPAVAVEGPRRDKQKLPTLFWPDPGDRSERRQPALGRGRGGGIVIVATQKEVAADLARYLKATKEGPVVITSEGKPVAVLLGSGSDDDLERLLMGHSPKLQAILESARKRFREGRGIPHETFWKEVEADNASKATGRRRPGKSGRARQ